MSRADVVLFNREVPGFASVITDSRDGSRQIVEHLAALGHRSIAYLSGPALWTDAERWRTLSENAARLGVEIVRLGPFMPTLDQGSAAADVGLGSGATALVAFNDLLAIGILQRLRRRKVDVPGAISVVGHDDIFGADFCQPSLTTVHSDVEHAGRTLVDLVRGRIVEPTGHPDRDPHPTRGSRIDGGLYMTDSGRSVVRIAVAGAGLIGKRHIEEIDASDSAVLASIVDPGPAGPELAHRYGVPSYPSLAELFARDKPDGLILATPNQMHVAGGLECVEAGVPVIVEKPIGDTVAVSHPTRRGRRRGRGSGADRPPPQLQPDHDKGTRDHRKRCSGKACRRLRHRPVLQAGRLFRRWRRMATRGRGRAHLAEPDP